MRTAYTIFTLALLAGCATPQVTPIGLEDVAAAPVIAFIEDGVTTREEVLLKLGTPAAQFEGDRILTYQLRVDRDEQIAVFWPRRSEIHPILTDWRRDIFSLVLVFGATGLLETHSLVGAK